MGAVRNSAPARKLAEEFYRGIDKHKDRSLDRNYAPDIDDVAWKNHGVGKKNRIYGAACTYEKNVHSQKPVDGHADKTVKYSA